VLKFKTIFSSFLLLFITVSLSGCKLIMLNPKGMIAIDEKNIMIISVLLMLIVVIPVIFLSLYFAYRYRENNFNAVYTPNWSHSTLLEIVCWTVPLLIIIVLGTITWTSSHRLDPYKAIAEKEKTITIQAIALEWKWLFIYPEQQIASVNYVQFPVNTPIEFLITSEGPMNSFHLPQIAGQIYAMSGMQTKLNLIADTLGDYRGMSSNFSGNGFSGMTFTAHVGTQEEFNTWVKSTKHSAHPLTVSSYETLIKPSENSPIQLFSSVPADLFETVMMKYMMPMDDPHKKMDHKKNSHSKVM
jgi:cytochrome o ubiquinol oxidase subunit 2